MELKSEQTANSIVLSPACPMENLMTRIRLGHPCNMSCRFCYQQRMTPDWQQAVMPREWLYNYLRPVYARSSYLIMTGGEITYLKEGYDFLKFLSENYPALNVATESNGLLFSEKWRDLCVRHLHTSHFSVNAATPEVFAEAVWPEGGGIVFDRVIANIEALTGRMKSEGLAAFAPSLSMVVNRRSCRDVRAFIKLALSLGCRKVNFYIEHDEGGDGAEHLACPEVMLQPLEDIMNIERLLRGYFRIWFSLWMPRSDPKNLQGVVEAADLAELRRRYADIWELAAGRDIEQESIERKRLRTEFGKKPLSSAQDQSPFIYRVTAPAEAAGSDICPAPFHTIDVWPTGYINFCSWVNKHMPIRIQDFIRDDSVDWAAIWGHEAWRDIRSQMLQGQCPRCQITCPLHTANPHLRDYLPLEEV